MKIWLTTLTLLLAMGMMACDSEAPADAPRGPAVEAGAIKVIAPGGDTRCARDTEFRFAVKGGDPNKIIIDFAGGGGCWNALTCAASAQLFNQEAPTEQQFASWLADGTVDGMYADDAADSPVDGWTIVHIPYCTGDIHWGDTVTEYGPDNTVHHVGQRNTQAVLDWVFENYDAPDEVLVSGCSAGAYGAIAYSPKVAEHYQGAALTVLADSGAGVLSDAFLPESFPNWNALGALPQIPGVAGRDVTEMAIADLYIAVAAAFPAMRVAQYNTAYDIRQTFYYRAMGGGGDWTDAMLASQATIDTATTNFTYYIAPGQTHCILPYKHYFTRETGADQTDFTGWLGELLAGGDLPAPVACDGAGCLSDPVCEGCLSGTYDGMECRFCEGWTVPETAVE